jgi:hypothetical protein
VVEAGFKPTTTVFNFQLVKLKVYPVEINQKRPLLIWLF